MLATQTRNYRHHQIFPPPTPMKTPIFALLCVLFLIITSLFASKRFSNEALPVASTATIDSLYVEPTLLSPTDSLLALAQDFLNQSYFDSARVYAENAHIIASSSTDQRGIVRSECMQGEALRKVGAFEKATQVLESCLQQSLDWFGEDDLTYAEANNVLGVVAHEQGRYEEALAYYEKALAIRRRSEENVDLDIARVLNQIGANYSDRGFTDKAMSLYEESLRIRKRELGVDHLDVSQSYNNIANLHFEVGSMAKAVEFHKEALRIRSSIAGIEHIETAISLHNLANALGELEYHAVALDLHRKSLEILRNTLGDHHYFVHLSIGSVSVDHKGLGQFDSALVYLDRSLALQKNYLPANSLYLEPTLHNLGSHYYSRKDYAKSAYFYKEALDNSLLNLGSVHPKVANNYNALAGLALQQKLYLEAISLAERSLSSNKHLQKELKLQLSSELGVYISISYAIQAIGILAEAYLGLGKSVTGIQQHVYLSKANEKFLKLFDYLETFRYLFIREADKILLLEEYESAYSSYLELVAIMSRTESSEQHFEKAFSVVEKNKFASLLDAVNESDARRISGIADSLMIYEHELRADLAYNQQLLKSELIRGKQASSTKVTEIQSKIFTLNRAYENLLDSLETAYPQYYNLKHEQYRATVDDVRARIVKKNDVLIEYFSGENFLYTIAITDDKIKFLEVPYTDSLKSSISSFLNANIFASKGSFSENSYFLYEQLLAPIEDLIHNKENWIIAPHGKLHHIPFGVLSSTQWSDSLSYYHAPYLLRDHNIRYIYSSTIQILDQQRKPQSWDKDFLAFAPVFEDGLAPDSPGLQLLSGQRGAAEPIQINLGEQILEWPATDSTIQPVPDVPEGWGSLPYTRREVKEIKKLFNATYNWAEWLFSNKSSVVLEDDATEANLKTMDLSQHRYLHFATHGIINASTPELSGILMAQDTTNGEDGVLHLGEIYNLKLNADLVVLSACETGLGKLTGGEGMIGLARGFKYAGANSLLVSLWPVEDISTQRLMTAFYDHLLQGKSKAEALKLAKFDLMQSGYRFSNPFHWAGFILIGE